MAITVNRITVAAPVLNAITLGAGGSLSVGTTYYYRAIAIRRIGSDVNSYRICFSEASAEQSVTPTSGNQTAQLSWPAVADAIAYILQRTTTSGSYPVDGNNSLNLNGQGYAGYPYATTQTSLNDDGGAATNIRFNSYNMDFETELPIIEVYGGSITDVATLYDIYAALVGGGYSDMELLGSSQLLAAANWQGEGAYLLRGILYLRDCTYRHRGTLLTVPGDLFIKNDSVILEMGSNTVNYSPVHLRLGIGLIPYTTNNNSFAGNYENSSSIKGKSGESNNIDKAFIRPIVYSRVGHYNTICYTEHAFGRYDSQYCNINDSVIGLGKAYGEHNYQEEASYNNIYESLQFGAATLIGALIRFAHIIPYNSSNAIYRRCKNIRASRDCEPWYGSQAATQFIDHTFAALGQTDNQPKWQAQRNVTTGQATVILAVTRNFLVLDADGPVAGAEITALNANGLSAFWEDSLATFSNALNHTTDPGSLTVSDGTKFSEGDYIRCETMGECLKVTNIAGNVLTVARAQLGTTIRLHKTGNNNRVLKMVDYLTTDANGEAEGDEPVLQREIYSLSGGGNQTNYEDTLITNGYLGRNLCGPYALTISKAGYADYVEARFLDPDVDKFPLGPQVVEVALSPPGSGVSPTQFGLVPLGIKQGVV